MRCLLIVDPQNDFIDGSLPVSGAAASMDNLSQWLHYQDYNLKIVTLDFHPYNHSSFKKFGGLWPEHCIAYSTGAAIWPRLFTSLYETTGNVEIFCKGTQKNKEEYSIFQNENSKYAILKLLQINKINKIDICGIAGDICVLNTLKDGISILGAEKFCVLDQFSPSLDNGSTLHSYIKGQSLCVK